MSDASQAAHAGKALRPSYPQQSAGHLAHIRELDGLRGIAALMVFFHHVTRVGTPDQWVMPIRLLQTVSKGAYTGVDVFFVLSGFLITSLLLLARDRPYYYHDFYWKRALRILPLYVVCLALVYALVPGSGSYVVLCLFFVGNFAHLFHITSVGPFWTLAIEEQFYLVWPTAVRRRSLAQLRYWALGIVAVTILLRLVDASFSHRDYYFTFFHCDGLACGAFLACWFHGKSSEERLAPAVRRPIRLVLLAGAILLAVGFLPNSTERGWAFEAASIQTGITFLAAGVVAALIAASGRRSVAIFRSRFLTFFGLISYALYMVHLYIMDWYDKRHPPMVLGDTATYMVRFGAILAITVAVCLVSRYVIELPAISLRRFVLVKPAPPNPHPTPDDPPIPLGNM